MRISAKLVEGETLQLLGYRGFAELATELGKGANGGTLTVKAMRNYAWKDRRRGHPFLLPQPIAVSEDGLPFWLPEQVRTWERHRTGSRNVA
jgi:hypothetical protein